MKYKRHVSGFRVADVPFIRNLLILKVYHARINCCDRLRHIIGKRTTATVRFVVFSYPHPTLPPPPFYAKV